MQGIWFDGPRRPKSKKAVKEALAAGERVYLEATSMFGNEPSGLVTGENVPDGQFYFVGPDPHTDRRFYGVLTKHNGTVTVK